MYSANNILVLWFQITTARFAFGIPLTKSTYLRMNLCHLAGPSRILRGMVKVNGSSLGEREEKSRHSTSMLLQQNATFYLSLVHTLVILKHFRTGLLALVSHISRWIYFNMYRFGHVFAADAGNSLGEIMGQSKAINSVDMRYTAYSEPVL